jgi:hypothetical protein
MTVASASKRSTGERRTLILWALLVRDGAGAFQNELRPEPDKGDRDGLAAEGLIRSEKRGRRIWIEATDKGWAWAGDNLGADLPKRSSDGSQVLQAWLTRLKGFIEARGIVLADILAAPSAAAPPASEAPPAATRTDETSVRERIRRAYLDLTGGHLNQRVPLYEVRARLPDVAREVVDHALTNMHLEDAATLSGIDNPQEITPAIREAGLSFKGEPKFVLWITQ